MSNRDKALAAAESICNDDRWTGHTSILTSLGETFAFAWWLEGTREQIVIALCFFAATQE